MPDRDTLAASGTIYVTQAAARQYAAVRGLRGEEARRELTQVLLDARRGPDARSGAEVWRIRSRTTQLDVQAHVARDQGLAVVVHVHVRDYLSA